jgi:predicted regulator of Ras-like GTPase activity (Roadblock/LC7/MglB family)
VNLPFLRFLKRDKRPAAGGVALAPPPIVPIEKPASERFGKTVRPNTSRVVALEPSETFPVEPSPSAATAVAASFAATVAPAPGGSRKISLGGPEMPGFGPSGAERTIALQLADLVPLIPGGTLAPAEIDPHHRVLLKASELERGMASGHPTMLLRAIYQQAPEFFSRPVSESDQTEVALPFGKVLEQFTSFQVRADQVCEAAVPEMETPFLQATIEDNKRFGKAAVPVAVPKPPIAETPLAPVSMAPEGAPAAPAVPETQAPPPASVPEIKPPKPIRLTLPADETGSPPLAPAPIRLNPAAAHSPIAAKISPNGTGVPATERVPASSGPSVPTPLPSPFAPKPVPAPARIAFKVSPPSNDLREPLAPERPSLQPEAAAAPPDGPGVRLPLRAVLRGIPPFQLSGPIDEVPETAQIEFAFSIVEPQLSLGRISVSPAQFLAALPEEFRSRFKLEESETPVALPLQEVLQNLPDASLQLRGDQEVQEIGEAFETPFSKKAAEDAVRFKAAPAPTPVAAGSREPAPMPVPEISTKAPSNPPEAPIRISIPANLPGSTPPATTEAKDSAGPDPKAIVAEASALPGVSACAVVFSDGLSLAGNIPAETGAEALCAIAPSIMKRLGDQLSGANLGSLDGLTLFCAHRPISFFAHGNICLAALHAAPELTPATRFRLNSTAQELARTYTQPSLPNA